MQHLSFEIREPNTAADFEAYYEFRWQALRAPWGQPRGSERDDREDLPGTLHLMAVDAQGACVACGRLNRVSTNQAQIRSMATAPSTRGCGLGRAMMDALETRAREQGIQSFFLNSRDYAVPFYEKCGYRRLEAGETLWGIIPHFKMAKP